MLKSWLSTGMLLVGLGGTWIAGCDDSQSDDESVGGSEDNLRGRGRRPKPDAEAPKPEDATAPSELPASCAALLCPTNTRCVVKEVQCIRAPCPPIASCELIEPAPEDASVPVATCEATLCKTGTVCVDKPTGAECVEPSSGASCAATLCRAGTSCIETAQGARCIKQACTAKCFAGQHCELHEVACVRAPCLPQPTCVDNID